ncbi:hypothetical protein [Actinoplanes sp. NPDC020271]|uniref:hypothetical protein n=1 Tax=Actinoplanes sp. NPDC020271 TaxID=3363896 RepID=UPI00378E3755
MRTFGIVLAALGLGAFVGAQTGAALTIPAAVAGGLGLLLVAFGKRDGGKDLIPGPSAASVTGKEKPTLSGLGARVEQILQLAEEQAADKVAEANKEAARIIADAEVEANKRRPLGA